MTGKGFPRIEDTGAVERKFPARTPLGKKLAEIRLRAIANGMELLSEAQIAREIERRRGELPDGEAADIR
jgi:hypothetical protein